MPNTDYYQHDAEAVSPAAFVRHTIGSRSLSDNHQAFFARHPSGAGSILDIGCGDGHFLEAAQARGFHTVGIDLDAKALEVGSKRGLEELYCGTIDSVTPTLHGIGNRYDFVTFFEVLEHQADPLHFLHAAIRLVRPGGLIAGSVPNRNCFRTPSFERSDRPPYHFTRWSKIALEKFLERFGFQEISVVDVGFGYYLLGLFETLNLKAKRRLLCASTELELKTYPVEDAAMMCHVAETRLQFVKFLKKAKAQLFSPLIRVEAGLGRIAVKGRFLYFEGRLPS